jgi:hypothetical protein
MSLHQRRSRIGANLRGMKSQNPVVFGNTCGPQCDNMSETPDPGKIKVVGKVNPHARIYDIASIQ